MFCRLVRNWLMDYHLEELSERADRLVEWHLRSCERCRRESRELVNLINAIQHHLGAEWYHAPLTESWERVGKSAPSPLRRWVVRTIAAGVVFAVVAAAWLAFLPSRQDPEQFARLVKGPPAVDRRAPGRTIAPHPLPKAAGRVVAVDHGSRTITVVATEGSALAAGQRLRTAPPHQPGTAAPAATLVLQVTKHRGAGRYQCSVVGPARDVSRVRPGWTVHLQDGDRPKANSR